MSRETFYFNTGVSFHPAAVLMPGQVWRGGVKQIPFDCEGVPPGSTFLFACSDPDLPEARNPGVVVRRILPGSGLASKYAYFREPGLAFRNTPG